MKVILICRDTLSSCCPFLLVGFCITRIHYFSKIKNEEVCQVVDQAKIALTLVQNWICKNEI